MDDTMRILKMVEDGKITAEQAKDLIEAMRDEGPKEEPKVNFTQVDTYTMPKKNKMFHITVDSTNGDKVNMQFPVSIVKNIIHISGKLPVENINFEGLDMDGLVDSVADFLDNDETGDIINVETANGDKIRIFVE